MDSSRNPSLPDDMIEDIFARMPAKSVQRCRCLSRTWAARLSSRRFVDRHLRLANRRGSPRLFFLPEYFSADTTVHAWSPGRPLDLEVVRRDDRLRRLRAVTRHCRGLVVLEAGAATSFDGRFATYESNHYVCNPSTGQITALPKGKWSFGRPPHYHDNLGIGYDTSIQKHKVVRLSAARSLRRERSMFSIPRDTGGHRPVPAGHCRRPLQQMSAPTRASLRRATCTGPRSRTGSSTAKGSSYPSRSATRCSPSCHRPMPMYPCRLTEFDGQLCLFNNSDSYQRVYDIWVLHDHRAAAWDLHCRIDLDTASLADTRLRCSWGVIPIDIVEDGSRILLRLDPHDMLRQTSMAHQLFVYRPATGDVEDLLTGGGIITHCIMTRRVVAPYKESLESTGRAHDHIISSFTSSQISGLAS